MDSNSYYTESTTVTEAGSSFSGEAFMASFLIFFVIIIVFYVIFAYLLSRVFKKAGVKPSIAWIPIYNSWKMLEIGGQKGFWAVLALIPLVNIASTIFMYIAMFHIGKKLGKEDWYIVLAIFLPPVWLAILALDDSKWNDGNSINLPINNTPPAYMPPIQSVDAQPNVPVMAQPPATEFPNTNPVAVAPNQTPDVNVEPNTNPPTTPVDNNFQQ